MEDLPEVTHLRWSKYSAAYRKRLLESGKLLGIFLYKHNASFRKLSRAKASQVDELASAFVQELHENDPSKMLRMAKHAVLFLQIWQPRLRRNLPETWSHLNSWEELRPAGFRAPLPITLLVAMICQSRILGYQSEIEQDKRLWWIFSVLIGVGFFGLLRPGEIFNMRCEDVSLPNAISLGSPFAVLRIRSPKNARQMGRHQYTTVKHPDVGDWLVWLIHDRKTSGSAVWPGSQQKFRRFFKICCDKLGIAHCKFSPASLRAGGATWHVDQTSSDIGRLRFEGRWTNLRSLEHYVQVARSQQLLLSIEDQTSERISQFVSQHAFLLSLPKFLELKLPSAQLVSLAPLAVGPREHVSRACRRWGERTGTQEAV